MKKKQKEKPKKLIDKYFELKIKSEKPKFQVLMEKYEMYNSLKETTENINIKLDNSTQIIK